MGQTMVNFRIDEDVKSKMESACKEMGLSVSAAFNIFAVKVGNERRIPFEVAAVPSYSETHMQYLQKMVAEIENSKTVLQKDETIEE